MKFCLMILGAVCFAGAVHAGFVQADNTNYVHKMANLYTNAKRGVDNQDMEKRSCYRCHGAKCPCLDFGLLKAYTNIVGNVVITCQEYRVWNLILNQKKEKRDSNDYYNITCQIMEHIGQAYEEYINSPTCPDEVTSCCEYREQLVAFHCLDVYMMLEDLHVVEYVAKEIFDIDPEPKKDLLVQHLESAMLSDCNYIFGSFECLVKGFLGQPCTEEEEADEESGEPEAAEEIEEENSGETAETSEAQTVEISLNETARTGNVAGAKRGSSKKSGVQKKDETQKRVDTLIEKILKRLNALSQE